MSGSITALVRTLVSVGATPEQILAAVETAETSKDDALERSREKARNRIKKWREKQPCNVTERSVTVTKRLVRGEDSSSKKVISGEDKKDASPSAQPKRASRLPADWSLPLDWHDEAVKAGLPVNRVLIEADKMRNWSLSNRNGAKLDWLATWRNWYRGAIDQIPRSTDPPKPSRPRNAGELARMQLREMGMIPDAADNEKRHLGKSDGGANPPVTGLARRFAIAANG